jgi:hypothetical protein
MVTAVQVAITATPASVTKNWSICMISKVASCGKVWG